MVIHDLSVSSSHIDNTILTVAVNHLFGLLDPWCFSGLMFTCKLYTKKYYFSYLFVHSFMEFILLLDLLHILSYMFIDLFINAFI